MSAVEVRVLGAASLHVDGVARTLPRKAFAVLCALCLDGPLSREVLAALLWERQPHLARQSLRNAVLALRQALRPQGALLHVTRDRLAVEPQAVWLDAGQLAGAAPADLLGLWRGPLLDGLGIRDSAPWDDWVAGQEENLSRLHLDRCLDLGTRALEAGDPALAAALAGQALRVTPVSEHAARLLIQAHCAEGKEALAHLSAAQFCRRFRAEFGADPDLPALPLPATPQPQPMLPQPPGIQSPGTWPPLPQPLTCFIGRDLERRAVPEALRTGRLVTLHGPTGIGKTRLALQVARDMQESASEIRVQFVPLDDLREPGAVLPRLAEVLGVRTGPDPLAALAAALRETPTLLVLDNAEHVLDAADEWPRLLAACPGLRLLVTSREVLNLRAEQVISLDGLEVPAPDCPAAQARQSDAVRLFEDRARQAGGAFVLDAATLPDVRHLCALLGGAPLGLELAAAWTRGQTLPELRRALEAAVLDLASPHRDARPRHRGLRAALEHSWALLPGEARRDFCALGIFPASFDGKAAQAILGTTPARLAALLDRSLLRRDAAGRYSSHALLRAFAREKLGLDPARQRRLADRHAAHYRAALDRLNTASGGVSPPLLAYVQAEEANILALVDHLLVRAGQGELDRLEQVAEPLLWHYPTRGRPAESLRLCRRAVEVLRPHGEAADLALAVFLNMQGWLEYFFGDLHEAQRLYEEAAVRADRVGDPSERTRALAGLGGVQSRVGQLMQAVASCQAGVQAAAPLNPVRRYRMLTELGIAWTYAGNVPEAVRSYAQAQALLETGEVDSPLDVVACLNGVGAVRMMAGQPAAAHAAFAEADRLARLAGSVAQRPGILVLTALTHAVHAGPESAAQAYLAQAQQLLGERREPWVECQIEHVQARLALARGDPGAAADHCARACRIAWPSGNISITFWVLPVYARTLAAQGDLPRAAEVVGLLLSHPASSGWTRAQAEALLGEWRGQGVAEELAAAVERGAGLEVEALFASSDAKGEARARA
ncbi:hypothetical protein DEIPH_ctg010orf0013 [Deinococcus phoenicis]|uniref:Bacterial transcriptional activator domain-containing protein n=1 Tax=Deinococcus phoenicis TaxID=1476583 RepID=A0A016QTX3_9DEIO|nr:AAA family ATPase [Deinococcus phoenicis]EYB69249.1 hypothetical protein DEIPH_ctg010orf0013 [Deinococcus phoenicis]